MFKRSFVAILLVVSVATASQDTISSNGIDSDGLLDINGQPLTGAGIAIGQDELFRPGDPTFDTMPALFNTTVDPTAVFYRRPGPPQTFNATVDGAGESNNHATGVAGTMISTDAQATGVATGASLYSIGHGPTPTDTDDIVASSIEHIASMTTPHLRAINLSFGIQFSPGDQPDGNRLITLFVDWSASHHDILYVVSGNQSAMPPMPNNLALVPADNFNGMTIGSSTEVDGQYRVVSATNDYSQDAIGPRTDISLIAPGDNVLNAFPGNQRAFTDGTSNSAPHVTGTVALLQQFGDQKIAAGATGWSVDARHHQVMKAVLLNSADKFEDDGSVNSILPAGYLPVPAHGLLGMEKDVVWLIQAIPIKHRHGLILPQSIKLRGATEKIYRWTCIWEQER